MSLFLFCSIFLFGIFINTCSLDLLKHKAQPEAAANGVEAWVKSEREMRERLQREKDAREVREQALVGFFDSFFLFFFQNMLTIILTSILAGKT